MNFQILPAKIRPWLAVGVVSAVLVGCGGAQTTPQTSSQPHSGASSGAQAQAVDEKALASSNDFEKQLAYAQSLLDTAPQKAAQWFERLALQGQGAAAYQLGLVQSDPKRAIEWFSMASAMGHAGAQYQLGEAYLFGEGTAQEPGWGLMWFERAARAGDADAQYALGVAMATGMIGGQRPEDAYVWLSIAKANKQSDVDLLLATVKPRLSEVALLRAEERVASWTNEPVSSSVEDRATLRFVQFALGRLGYQPGLADGIPGDRTTAAIAAFRVDQSLGEGGVDEAVLNRLRDRLADLAL